MKKEKSNTCLSIKQSSIHRIQLSKQTQSIRDKANKKIRMLGKKYYNVKYLFEKLNFKKDLLFIAGRELENIYKNKKKIDHLQTQTRRMKECVIIWYTEYLYSEIFQQNSFVLQYLLERNENNIYAEPDDPPIPNLISEINDQSSQQNLEIELPSNASTEEKADITSFFSDIKFNKEVDHFESSSHIKSHEKSDANSNEETNLDFNFSNYFKF